MGIRAVAVAEPDAVARDRLSRLGIDVETMPTGTDVLDDSGIREDLGLATETGALAAVSRRPELARDVADLMGAAERTLAASADGGPLTLVVLPASRPPQPGPVAILSPAGVSSAYELYVGAAVSSASGRRVEHLNGRGTAASAVHSGVAGRVLARSATPGWREHPHARPERSLHTLGSRPAVIVVAVPPGSMDAAQLVADHPDADVVLVFDRALARHGAVIAQQAAAMIELAFSLSAPTVSAAADSEAEGSDAAGSDARRPDHSDADPAPTAPAAGPGTPDSSGAELPAIRASDVVHVRLTADALELTNRSQQQLTVRVSLGAASEPTQPRAVFAADLVPGAMRSAPTAAVQGIQDLAPPVAVMRHWSHESEEVYEGGEQRILLFEVDVRDAAGAVHAHGAYRPGNGLDFFVTARDLSALIGRPVAMSIFPMPTSAPVTSAPPSDLFTAFSAALAVGAGVLAARTP